MKIHGRMLAQIFKILYGNTVMVCILQQLVHFGAPLKVFSNIIFVLILCPFFFLLLLFIINQVKVFSSCFLGKGEGKIEMPF